VFGGCGTGRTSLLLRLGRLLGRERSQYLDFAAAATTPERCLAAIETARGPLGRAGEAPPVDSPRQAFDRMAWLFDQPGGDAGPVTFLIDEVLDIRTFESFPGLRHVQRELVAQLAASPNHFVLASRFTARAHRLLRDAPARFEVIHLPPLTSHEVAAIAQSGGERAEWARAVAPAVTTLAAGRASYVTLLLEALAATGPATDPVAALAGLFAPEGRLAARCRESYEFRLQRARGYGALKAILGILAEDEPLNLTEIALRLHRTPGSTKDYLSWLEDVDLIASQRKRYSFDDPLLRLYVRLYGRAVPPSDDDLVREIQAYAQARLPRAGDRPEEPVYAAADRPPEPDHSGIIEID
jgi:hypothetical protein